MCTNTNTAINRSDIAYFLRYEEDFVEVREALRKFMYATSQMYLTANDGTFTKVLSDGLYYTDRLIELLEYHEKVMQKTS